MSWSSRPLSRTHGLARRQQDPSIRGFDMRATSRYLDPSLATRRWITAGLIAAGAVAGAVVGLALTVLGKVVAGAPPADPANYTWNAGVFAGLRAALAPLVRAPAGAALADDRRATGRRGSGRRSWCAPRFGGRIPPAHSAWCGGSRHAPEPGPQAEGPAAPQGGAGVRDSRTA